MSDRVLHIIQHSLGRDQYGQRPKGNEHEDYRNHFYAGPGHADFDACRDAVTQGLMREHAPSDISGGDFVFTVTDEGKAYVAKNSPPAPKLTRAQRRYQEWLRVDCGLTFGEWLRRGRGTA